MAERRMFSKQVIDSDMFLDMPLSTQSLYFHLAMRADDEGFLNNPSKIMKVIGANRNDMDLLIVKKFIIPFDSGIVVIKHWFIHNYIQNDRFKPTVYRDERLLLDRKENKVYTLRKEQIDLFSNDEKNDSGYSLDTQYRGEEYSLEENSIDKKSKKGTKKDFVPPTLNEVQDYCKKRKNNVDPNRWFNFYLAKNWMIGKNKMKDWKAAVRTWENSNSNKEVSTNAKSQEPITPYVRREDR